MTVNQYSPTIMDFTTLSILLVYYFLLNIKFKCFVKLLNKNNLYTNIGIVSIVILIYIPSRTDQHGS